MIVDDIQYKDWSQILSKCINDLNTKYPGESEANLAEKIGLSRATFNRIKNDKSLPRIDNIIKIILGSGNINFLTKALKIHGSGLGESIGEILEVALSEKDKINIPDTIKNHLLEPDYFITYLMCSMSKGVSKEMIRDVVGSPAKKIINNFLEFDIIFVHENKYHLKNQGIIVRDFINFKHHLPTYSKYYQPNHVGKKRNYCHSLTEGLNQNGLTKILKAHKDFHDKCKEILREPGNHGEIPYFSVAYCDSFNSIQGLRE